MVVKAKMLTLLEVEKQISDLLRQQIKDRQEMIRGMVGSFYPGILEDEIYKLRRWLSAISDRE